MIMAFLIAIDITIVLSVNILGGNQSDVVKVSRYAKKDVVGYRLPASPTASAAAEPSPPPPISAHSTPLPPGTRVRVDRPWGRPKE